MYKRNILYLAIEKHTHTIITKKTVNRSSQLFLLFLSYIHFLSTSCTLNEYLQNKIIKTKKRDL